MVKKVALASLVIIIVLLAAWQGYTWRNTRPGQSVNPQPENHETIAPPAPNEPNGADQAIPVRVLDILGRSDKLTTPEWTAMQQWRSSVKQIATENPTTVFINGSGAKPEVALTFDDGPEDVITPQVLDILREYRITATFFFKGNQLDHYTGVVKQAYTDGNLIASHAYSHQELDKMNQTDIDKEIVASDRAFKRVIGVVPAMIRPPFGSINQDVLNVCQNQQEKIILWSIDTLDWSEPEPEHIAKNVLDNVRPGDIILMHSVKDQEATVQALPLIIRGLQAKGYTMVNLSELLKIPAYKN